MFIPECLVRLQNTLKYAEYLNQYEGLAIDIGSNDGTILKAFWLGYEVLGTLLAIVDEVIKNGIDTIIDFFNPVVTVKKNMVK